jgi:AcrR family transcriptional regulator
MDHRNHVEAVPERRERSDARENRRLLLAVAKQLFAAQGAAATSMKEIARAAGVGQGTLYRHFAHKGELCGALIKEDLTDFQERIGTLIDDPQAGASPLARLDLLLGERIRLTESHLPLFAAMEEAMTAEQRAKQFRGPFGTWTHEHIVRLLTEAVAQGEVAPLDITFSADAILAAVSPQLYSYQRHECGYSVERIIAGLRRLYIDGLRRELVS